MNLVFVAREPYPDGGAATNRHIAYARGLLELGHDVTTLLLSKQEDNNPRFEFEGLNFICAANYDEKEISNPFRKSWLYLLKVRKGMKIIKRLNSTRKIDALILLTTLNRDLVLFTRLAKKINVKVLHERTEYPYVDKAKSASNKIKLYFLLHIILPRFTGIYVINHALKAYFNKFTNSTIPIEVINMVVDPSRFVKKENGSSGGSRYLTYCGTLNDMKDGVGILTEAYARALQSGKICDEIKLMLIGPYEDMSFKNRLEAIINDYNCGDKIILTGKLTRHEVPDYLNMSYALALARPDNEQAEGGFPTKLGEYLATGKPVIITEVGEINRFFKDGVNAFIAKPGDINDFSEKIVAVFTDYERALEVGRCGRKLVENEFNYLKQAEKLAQFIMSL